MSRFRIFLIVFLAGMAAGIEGYTQPDSLVTFTGVLINSRNGTPLANTAVVYKKLPYESEMGNLVTDSEGKFTAYFRAHEKYSVLIEKEGFIKLAEVIDPLEGASADLVVDRTFKIHEGGVGSVIELGTLKFSRSESIILEESFPELDNLAEMLTDNTTLQIQLEGHTDYIGNSTVNLNLSQRRVDAVKKYLTDKGADAEQIKTKAFGGSQPLVRSTSSQARAKNRRVEVRILSDSR